MKGYPPPTLSRSSLLAATVIATLVVPAYAEISMSKIAQSTQSISFDRCLDTGDARMGVMPAIFECYTDELARKDRTLNDTYRSVRKALAPAKQQELQSLERRWISFRDRKCKAEADKEGGAGSQDSTIIWYGCLIRETDQRIERLKDFAR